MFHDSPKSGVCPDSSPTPLQDPPRQTKRMWKLQPAKNGARVVLNSQHAGRGGPLRIGTIRAPGVGVSRFAKLHLR